MSEAAAASSGMRRMLHHLAQEVRDRRVLAAMAAVPREAFVPERARSLAYADRALAIGHRQTISQPLIVALMTEALELQGDERVLEIGTGSGYQAAILAQLAAEVVTVERVPELREQAERRLHGLGVEGVEFRSAGPSLGAPECAPFDAIIVTAAMPSLAPELLTQLSEGGRIVAPVGERVQQELLAGVRRDDRVSTRTLGGCRFVPLLGPGGFSEDDA